MRQRLLLCGIACALIVGGWAGVLAAVVCPHAGGTATAGEASHDCCRGQEDADGAGCPMMLGRSGGDHHQQQATDDSHGASHVSREEPRARDAESAVGARGLRFERGADFCAHCVGKRLPPPSPNRLSAPEAAKRGDVCAAPRVEKPPSPSPLLFVREVIPSQGAPPGPARLYVLNSSFLI
jgi:hypothetical protein